MTSTWGKQHPDLNDDGSLRDDMHLPSARRDFNRMAANPARWQAFYDGITAEQQLEHPEVQAWIGGRHYEGDAYTGYQKYLADKRWAREQLGSDLGESSADIRRQSQAEYEATHDQYGRRLDGVAFRPTTRDVVLDSEALDPFTAAEWRSAQQRGRA